jgi:hypothetical protein
VTVTISVAFVSMLAALASFHILVMNSLVLVSFIALGVIFLWDFPLTIFGWVLLISFVLLVMHFETFQAFRSRQTFLLSDFMERDQTELSMWEERRRYLLRQAVPPHIFALVEAEKLSMANLMRGCSVRVDGAVMHVIISDAKSLNCSPERYRDQLLHFKRLMLTLATRHGMLLVKHVGEAFVFSTPFEVRSKGSRTESHPIRESHLEDESSTIESPAIQIQPVSSSEDETFIEMV